jgi:outer membrane protein assembly factor BamB
MEIQWYGPPGPREMTDRHHRGTPPLYKDGRLFRLGDNRLSAVDAYNGALLWELDVPNSRRLGIMRDAGPMSVTEGCLYAASGSECWALEPATGERLKTFNVSEPGSCWGYVAVVDDVLYGSAQKPTASLNTPQPKLLNLIESDFRLAALSGRLFALDRKTGTRLWTRSAGAILNPTLAIGGGRIYFLESRDPAIGNEKDGRVRIDKFLADDAWLVALDAKTGRVAWEQKAAFNFQQIAFLSYADGVLLATGSYNLEKEKKVHYRLHGLEAATGKETWTADFEGGEVNGSHGEQWQHPAIVGGRVCVMGGAYDLKTGAMKTQPGPKWRKGGHGCGTISASASFLFYRGSQPTMMDIATGNAARLTQVTRPGCWINIIAAGGLVLIPEGSAGCTCDYSIQTSIAFLPASK